MALNELSNVLWRERELLELLLFKLEEEQLVLSAGKARWIGHASREVEMVVERIRETEVVRAVEVDRVAAELRLAPGPSLQALVDAAPSPWSTVFHDHQRTFFELTQEINAAAQANRELLVRGQQATRDALAWLGAAEPEVYSRRGATASAAPAATVHFVDEAI